MPSEAAVTVLVVEDDPVLREEFAGMVRGAPHLALFGTADDLAQARTLLRPGGRPDVAIVDLGLPDGDGCALIQELTEVPGRTAVLVATVFGDERHVVRALEAGAHGYLLKDSTLDEFARAVRVVREGGSPLSPSVARHLLKRFAPAPAPAGVPAPERLSVREAQVLTCIAQGQPVPEVAAALNLSVHTVNTHVKNIYSKLAVSNRVQAVNRARATGQIR